MLSFYGAGGTGGDVLCATLLAGGVGSAGGARGDALYATLLDREVLEMLEVPKVMCRVLLCMLAATKGTLFAGSAGDDGGDGGDGGALEVRCKREDVEMYRYEALEL
jgi:hypothetical protein